MNYLPCKKRMLHLRSSRKLGWDPRFKTRYQLIQHNFSISYHQASITVPRLNSLVFGTSWCLRKSRTPIMTVRSWNSIFISTSWCMWCIHTTRIACRCQPMSLKKSWKESRLNSSSSSTLRGQTFPRLLSFWHTMRCHTFPTRCNTRHSSLCSLWNGLRT